MGIKSHTMYAGDPAPAPPTCWDPSCTGADGGPAGGSGGSGTCQLATRTHTLILAAPGCGNGGASPSPCPSGPPGSSCIASGAPCQNAIPKNETVNGNSDHNDMVSNAFALYAQIDGGAGSQQIAYEYQTYGGQEYIQFFVTPSAGVNAGPFSFGVGSTSPPIVPFNGDTYSALQDAAAMVGMAMTALPAPLNDVAPTTGITKTECNSKTWPTG